MRDRSAARGDQETIIGLRMQKSARTVNRQGTQNPIAIGFDVCYMPYRKVVRIYENIAKNDPKNAC